MAARVAAGVSLAPRPRQIPSSQQIKIVEECLHAGIETVQVHELKRQALGQASGENSWRIELLEAGQSRLDPFHGAAQNLCNGVQISGHISSLVQHVDQMQTDEAVNGIGQIHGQLADEMIA